MERRKILFSKASIFILLMLIILSVSAVLVYFKIRTDEVGAEVKQGNTISFLFMLGEGGSLEYSEAVMLQSSTGKCAIFDIPNHIGTLISSKNRIDRIDSVFDEEDPREYITQVEKLMGIGIDHYLYITTKDLEKLVDLLEGVNLFIANPVEFQGEERVLIPSGSVTLDGPKAVTYSLYEEPGERGTDRSSRRQKLLQSLLKKIGDMQSYIEKPEVMDLAYGLFSSNLSQRAFSSLMKAFSVLDEDQFIFQRVLGKEQSVEGETLLFPHYDGTLLKETVQQTKKSLENEEVMSTEQLNVTIELLNGTLTNGLAGRTSQVFKSFGYDVARVSNALQQDREKTVVIARTENLSAAQRVANIIRCKNVVSGMGKVKENTAETVGGEPIDVTVILGKDFDGRYCKE